MPDIRVKSVGRYVARQLRRMGRPIGGLLKPPAEPACDVLFLIGLWEGESKRYRVYNLIEGMEEWGYSAQALVLADCRKIIARKMRPRVVVFFRTPYDPKMHIPELLEYCRANGITTVFDVDDYVFEPSIIADIAGVAELDEGQKVDYGKGVLAYRTMLLECDRATTTTEFLRDRIKALGRDAFVVRNTVNRAQRILAGDLVAGRKRDGAAIRISYFSGSKTHARDFAQCAPALQAIMRRHPNVRFRLVGLLDLDESWVPFADRIERADFMPMLDMLRSLSECDINLAPLEEGDLFCEGKSELKFFEAAVVEVPTVASRTAPFAAAIQDGVTGFLASTEREWEEKLDRLVRSPALREAIGGAAAASAVEHFSTAVAARSALTAYGLEEQIGARVRPGGGGIRIGWIVPGLIIGGGGHRNILRAAYHLEKFGHDVRLYFSDTQMSKSELRQSVREHFYPFEGPVNRFTGYVDGEDVLMATHWSTVALAESVKSQVGEIIYFVQDFEPAFYPMGSEYILAENTYRRNLYAITTGPWCADILKRDYGMEADSFQFPIDRTIYIPEAAGETQRGKRILFFAKPEMARRCFLIGTMALREFHRLKPDYEIMFFGSDSARKHPQDYPVTYLDNIIRLEDLARLYASSAAGLAFSTTNPSFVPYEMMACGLPVVDLGRPGNEVNYGGRRDLALLADADPARMARDMAALLDDAGQCALRSRAGLEFIASFPSEEAMARRIELLILERIGKRASSSPLSDVALDSRNSAAATADSFHQV